MGSHRQKGSNGTPAFSFLVGGFCSRLEHNTVYNNYGCFCGYGGGGTPIDGIDRCCEVHDRCYNEAKTSKKCRWSFKLYFDHYKWTC
ncbi:hypothetical protein OESDEN_03583 [Oesophagostomum dentatum]|uniref:Phospholipase A2 n=1 Tax=Oesophagostomum dentatum TaxID=61180 RepID=A0A0B1TM20_OESDE|nr:hypothetical protein OESDEN_03583 [Oesophagostomum dentatum]